MVLQESGEKYITVKERQRRAFEQILDKVLKDYSVVKITDGDGAHHGEDYEEMKKAILELY